MRIGVVGSLARNELITYETMRYNDSLMMMMMMMTG